MRSANGSTIRSDGKLRHLFLCETAIRTNLPRVKNTKGRDGSQRASCCLENYEQWVAPRGFKYIYLISWDIPLPCPLGKTFADWRHIGEGKDVQVRFYQHISQQEAISWLPPLDLIEQVVRAGYRSVKIELVGAAVPWRSAVPVEVATQRKFDEETPGFVTGAQTRRPSVPDWAAWHTSIARYLR